MKIITQKLPVTQQTSFVARTYTTPLFETTWHKHIEYELNLQLEGRGMCFIGNYVGDFKAGDIYLLGSNLPHEFKRENDEMKCSAMVIHFNKDLLGKQFWDLPECKEIAQLLDQSMFAIKLNDYVAELADNIRKLEYASGFERIIILSQCLLLISRDINKRTLSTHPMRDLHLSADHRINRVFEYTIKNFKDPVNLLKIASIANMSIAAFCRYFKRNTKKTYIEFLNEMKIGHASQALIDTEKPISQICYESGFTSIANFNKQFLKSKKVKPSEYRKKFQL